MARFKRRDPLTYARQFYRYTDTARQIPNPKQEYKKLRTVALNRIRKLERAGYGDTETVRRAREIFSKPASKLTEEGAIQRLPDAARFIVSQRGTVGGMREIERKTAETLQDRGLSFVNRKNVRLFTDFLDWLGASKLSREFYVAVSGAPREGVGMKEKSLQVEELQQAFKDWLVANDYKIT